MQDALWHGQAAAARRDLLGRREAHVPDVFLEAAAVFDLVAETLGGDEAGESAVHLDQGVVGDGGAVDDGVALTQEVAEFEAFLLRQLAEPFHHAQRAVLRGGQVFVQHHFVAFEKREVGESAADVDANAIGHILESSIPNHSSPSLSRGGGPPVGWWRGEQRLAPPSAASRLPPPRDKLGEDLCLPVTPPLPPWLPFRPAAPWSLRGPRRACSPRGCRSAPRRIWRARLRG